MESMNHSNQVNDATVSFHKTDQGSSYFYTGPTTCKTGIAGLEFDFNYGVRIKVPEGSWRIKIFDRDTLTLLYDAAYSDTVMTSHLKYYVNFRLEVYQDDKLIFEHNMDLEGKKVLIKYPVGVLGDIIAWFPYASIFKTRHNCELYCAMIPQLADLFKKNYPEIHFVGPDERPDDLYASYYMGVFSADDRCHQPVDFRVVGLQKTIPYILGLEPVEVRPKITPTNLERSIKEPYVCIGTQSTGQAKYWNNPIGWLTTVAYLKDKGYRVLCIDRDICNGSVNHWNLIPYGAEDFTGNIPLPERVNLLYHADFFIGLGSGLSWLAWAVGKPVIMISGFSLPISEFYTPYRVINYNVCNGCWNDSSIKFGHDDFEQCPRHRNTDRMFECTRFITAKQVQTAIEHLMKDYGYNSKI